MNIFDLIPVAFLLIALFGAFNYHVLKMPGTIGLVIVSLAVSLVVLVGDALMPSFHLAGAMRAVIRSIDFHDTLMQGMLSFLLFAGALHVDLEALKEKKWAIALMASLGVLVSTAVIGLGFYFATGVALTVALVFGAIISPTDPVAVMGILKTIHVPKSLETKIAGESLFNDGIAVVVFAVLAAIAFPAAGAHVELTPLGVLGFLLQEAVGGAVLGGVAGYLAFLLLRTIDDYVLEILITLALVTGVYSLATHLHMAGPIAVVVAGLFIGNHGKQFAMSETTRRHLDDFWHLIDEVLNAVLFLLIGFEVFAIQLEMNYLMAGIAAIPVMVFARFLAVVIPIKMLAKRHQFTTGAIPVLTWGGLRGGISVALALSLPHGPERDMLLTATYAVVIFSIVVQGTTVGALIRKAVKE